MTEQEFKEGLETRLNNVYRIIEESSKQGRLGASVFAENGDFLAPVVGELREQYLVDILQIGRFMEESGVELVITWGHD